MPRFRNWEQIAKRHGYHVLQTRTKFKTLAEKMFHDLCEIQGCSPYKIGLMLEIENGLIYYQIQKYKWYAPNMILSARKIKEIALARGVDPEEVEKEYNTPKICTRCRKKYYGPNRNTCPQCVAQKTTIYDCQMVA